MPPSELDLRVPKQPVIVEILLAGREPRRFELYLDPVGMNGRDPLCELLEHGPHFLPSKDVVAHAPIFFAAASVVWVRTTGEREEAAMPEAELLFDRRVRVRVELDAGGALEGEVMYSAPGEHARLSDHLNDAGRFLHLFRGDQHYLVSKEHVVRVLELAPAVRPGETTWHASTTT